MRPDPQPAKYSSNYLHKIKIKCYAVLPVMSCSPTVTFHDVFRNPFHVTVEKQKIFQIRATILNIRPSPTHHPLCQSAENHGTRYSSHVEMGHSRD